MANSDTGIIIGVVVTVVVVAGVVIYVATRKPGTPKTKPPGTVIPPPTPSQAASLFPIQYGATGDIVKQLQSGLNQYENVNIAEDGKFGSDTLSALQTAGFSAPVSLAEFTEITAPAYTETTDASGNAVDTNPNA